MAEVKTYGNVEGIIKNVLMSNGGTQEDTNGRLFLDGQAIGAELSRAIIEAVYLNEVYQDGLNCTAKYTDDVRKNGVVRVLTEMPFAPSSRTLSFGGRKGTPGNDGMFDVNPAIIPTEDEICIYLNQVNTQDLVFPDIAKEYIPLDVMTRKIAGFSKSVAQDRSASTTAEVLLYNIFRSLNGAENLINDIDFTTDNAYGNLVAKLNANFANGDPVTGALTTPTEGRCLICRPNFGYGIFNKNSGVILNGSNLAQEMLRGYDLSVGMSERHYVGAGYLGEFGEIHFIVMPDQLWTYAERYCGLADGALANVKAIALQADSLAVARGVDLGVKLQDTDSRYPRGVMARPINIWGHEQFRKAYLIGEKSAITNDLFKTTLAFSENERKYPVAPETANGYTAVTVPIFNEVGAVVGYQQVAQGQTPSGGNWQTGVKKSE